MQTAQHDERLPSFVFALAITSLVSYGALYYSFGAVLPDMASDLGMEGSQASLALTVSLLAVAACAPLAGRVFDVLGAAKPMAAGSGLAAMSLLAAASVGSYFQLLGAWLLVGVASSFVCYEPVFSLLVRHVAQAIRHRALLLVTVVGGLASTVYVPALGLLSERFGWRWALASCAATVIAINVPTHVLLARNLAAPTRMERQSRPRLPVSLLVHAPGRLIVIPQVCQGVVSGAVAAYLIIALVAIGQSQGAAYYAAGMLGVASVACRLVMARPWARARLSEFLAVVYVLQAAVLVALAIGPPSPVLPVLVGAVLGAAAGMGSFTRPQLAAAYLGVASFGAFDGAISGLVTLGRAGGPVAGALAFSVAGDYRSLWLMLAAFSAVSAVFVWKLRRHAPLR